jgi:O-antigen ligase
MSAPLRHRPPLSLENTVLVHVGVFFAFATWAFGGGADWVRFVMTGWGFLGALLIPLAILTTRSRVNLQRLNWLIPLALFDALVIFSTHTAGLRVVQAGTESFYAINALPAWRPSAAVPAASLRLLCLFNGIFLSCFNLAWIVRSRRALRSLLVFVASNALILAIFGTVQKLVRADGLYFGLVHSPQPTFFSSFIYHNHWGAFTVLMVAICIGLVWNYGIRQEGKRNLFHTPAFGGLVAVLFLAATAPLSTSRSCTILVALLLGGAFLHWLTHLAQQRRRYKESMAIPLAGALLAGVLALGGIYYLAAKTIAARVAKTEEQIADLREHKASASARVILYRDTWRMARDRIWFGWGMASYPPVFIFYNTQSPGPIDHLPVYYHDAHSDWLQAVAEHGLIGSALLALLGLIPLAPMLRRPPRSPLPAYLLAGCGLILLYAWLEFPFGNSAVVLSWWLCFFTAVQYTRLQYSAETGEPKTNEPTTTRPTTTDPSVRK